MMGLVSGMLLVDSMQLSSQCNYVVIMMVHFNEWFSYPLMIMMQLSNHCDDAFILVASIDNGTIILLVFSMIMMQLSFSYLL